MSDGLSGHSFPLVALPDTCLSGRMPISGGPVSVPVVPPVPPADGRNRCEPERTRAKTAIARVAKLEERLRRSKKIDGPGRLGNETSPELGEDRASLR